MRASHCVQVELPLAERVRLLRDEYLHFEDDAATLHAQLDCLAALHGGDKIGAWKTLADRGRWDELVERLLVEHYDPAYLRSIERNFSRVGEAQVVRAASAQDTSFAALAQQLAQR
jgi:tRNA 2-selenouridine synthase